MRGWPPAADRPHSWSLEDKVAAAEFGQRRRYDHWSSVVEQAPFFERLPEEVRSTIPIAVLTPTT
jgi:hypothetical protein